MSAMERLFAGMSGRGDSPALYDGMEIWSYARLLAEVDGWSRVLDRLDARRVGYRLPNGPDWIALDLALLRSGRPAVPIPDFFSSGQQQHVLCCSGVDTLVLAGGEPSEDACWPDGFTAADSRSGVVVLRRKVPAPPRLHADTAKITFTSGTTGAPKGVCLSAAHMLNTAWAIRSTLGGEGIDRHLCTLPLSLLLENVAGVYANLSNGSRICVPPLRELGMRGSSSLDVPRFVEAQQVHRPQSLILVPQLLLALTAAAEFGLALPDSFRFVAVGGGKVAPSLLDRAGRVGIPVYEGYGLTECGSVVSVNRPGASRPGSVGRPLPHLTVGIVDGEIQVLRAAMLGCLGERPANGRILTGDLGTVDEDGYLHVVGRRKHGFITAYGRNVSPEWIESELTSEIAIGQAVVFGEALPANVAIVVPRSGADETAVSSAVASVNERLPDYARVRVWHCAAAEAFAAEGCVTDNGRPRRELVAQAYRCELSELYAQLETLEHAAFRPAGA